MQVAGRTISKYSGALLVIVLIGALLRVYHLGTQGLWGDEIVSVWEAKMSLSQIVPVVTGAERSPPLYFLILHFWIALFGTSEVAVRLLSVLFGVLAIPIIYLLGRLLFKEEVGLLAALILAFSTLNVQYSQEARMYSLMVLLALLSMYFFTHFLQRRTVPILVGYIVCTTLLLYTHEYGVFVVIAQNIYLLTLLLLSHERAFRLRDWIGLQALLVAFFAPCIRVLISQTSEVEKGFWILPPTLNTLIQTLSAYAGSPILGFPETTMLRLFFVLSVLSLFTYLKVRGSMDWKAPVEALKSYAWEVSFTKDYNALYFLAVWLLAVNIIPFIISLFSQPIYLTRYTIAASVALYLIVAKGISHINYRYAKLAVVIVVVALSTANLQIYYTTITKPSAREAVGFINEHATNGDLVLVTGYDKIKSDYYGFVAGANVTQFPTTQGSASNIKELQSDISGRNRVWWMTWHGPTGSQLSQLQTIQTFSNASYNTTYHKGYLGFDVYLFERRA